jgi:hypothetical protein
MVWKDFLKAAIGEVESTSQEKGKKILLSVDEGIGG